ncbi:MAG: hypothetical protein ACXVFA_00400 [Solirubrobacteraceae bacterium]
MGRHAIRMSVVAIATAAIFALGASGAVAARTQIPVYDGPPHAGKNPLATPAQILWTGDTTGMFAGRGMPGRRPTFGRLHWSKWTATEGRATGANWLNDCLPYCAAGKWTPFNVNLTVYRPRICCHEQGVPLELPGLGAVGELGCQVSIAHDHHVVKFEPPRNQP